MLTTDRIIGLFFDEGYDECTVDPRLVGSTVFHGHAAALRIAALRNKKQGLKMYRVAVHDQHFWIERVS